MVEVDRDIEVLEKLENRRVKLKLDVFLKSFAEEEYSNLILNLPVPYENIFEVRDAFGNRLEFTGGRETSSITIPDIEPEGLKTVTIIYQESYPTIIITPDRDRYDLNSPVGLEILVINGGDKIEYPYVEVEIYTPGMDVIYSNMEDLESLEPLEKTELFEKFIIPAAAPTGTYVAAAKFREDFVTLASTTGNFYVVGAGAAMSEAVQTMIIVIVGGLLLYLSYKRLKEIRRTRRFSVGV